MPEPAAERNHHKAKSKEPVAVAAPDMPVAELSAAVEVASEGSDHTEPNAEEVALLAYSYWEARGYQGGSGEEDWLRAEQELRARNRRR